MKNFFISNMRKRRLRLSAKTPEGNKISLPCLANLVALSYTSLWQFENAKIGMTTATLTRLKEALGCSWNDLLDGCESRIVKERKRHFGEVRKKK